MSYCVTCKGVGLIEGPPVNHNGREYKGVMVPCLCRSKASAVAVAESEDGRNLRIEAGQWIHAHPKAMALYLRFARELQSRRLKFGIGLLTERIRWECKTERLTEDEYKINNNFRAYIARWLIEQDADFARLIETRETKW